MKQITPDTLTNASPTEGGRAEGRVEKARVMVAQGELLANQAEVRSQALDIELQRAEAAHERREKAERDAEQKTEKIAELTGGRG